MFMRISDVLNIVAEISEIISEISVGCLRELLQKFYVVVLKLSGGI